MESQQILQLDWTYISRNPRNIKISTVFALVRSQSFVLIHYIPQSSFTIKEYREKQGCYQEQNSSYMLHSVSTLSDSSTFTLESSCGLWQPPVSLFQTIFDSIPTHISSVQIYAGNAKNNIIPMKLQSDNKLRPYLPVTIQYPKWHNSLHKRNHT